MKILAALLLLLAGLLAPAAAGDYSAPHQVVFPGPKGGIVHTNPYPTSKRAAAVWAADGCWRTCSSSCAWKLETCVTSTDADICRPALDACDRSCQRSCRLRGGPLLGFFDW
jgi:hypothetical protein